MPARPIGVALLAASALAGVVAAALIPRPPWSLPAAIVLAAATVGVAAALMLLRRSEADAARASPGSTGASSASRHRRFASVSGGVLVAFAVATAATLFLPEAAMLEPIRAWSVIVVYGGCGAALLATGRRRTPSAVRSSERSGDDPVADGAEWVRLGDDRIGPGRRILTSQSAQLLLLQVPLLLVSLLPVLIRGDAWVAPIAIAIAAIVCVALAVVLARRSRPAWIARDGSALRHGSSVVPATAIDSAVLSYAPREPDATERDLLLTLGAPRGLRATVPLRRRGRLVLTEVQTATLVALVASSSIELPHDEHDPTGRFSKSSHPDHLTRAEAEAVVAHPPGDGEPLPTGWR